MRDAAEKVLNFRGWVANMVGRVRSSPKVCQLNWTQTWPILWIRQNLLRRRRSRPRSINLKLSSRAWKRTSRTWRLPSSPMRKVFGLHAIVWPGWNRLSYGFNTWR